MTFESKYAIGQSFILAGIPCVITAITFKQNSQPEYELEWTNPFNPINRVMTESQLVASIAISNFSDTHEKELATVDVIKRLTDELNDAIIKEENEATTSPTQIHPKEEDHE